MEEVYRFIVWCDLVREEGEEKKHTIYPEGKDHTRYKFKGIEYSKRRLVLDVVQDWVKTKKHKVKGCFLTIYCPQRHFYPH